MIKLFLIWLAPYCSFFVTAPHCYYCSEWSFKRAQHLILFIANFAGNGVVHREKVAVELHLGRVRPLVKRAELAQSLEIVCVIIRILHVPDKREKIG